MTWIILMLVLSFQALALNCLPFSLNIWFCRIYVMVLYMWCLGLYERVRVYIHLLVVRRHLGGSCNYLDIIKIDPHLKLIITISCFLWSKSFFMVSGFPSFPSLSYGRYQKESSIRIWNFGLLLCVYIHYFQSFKKR